MDASDDAAAGQDADAPPASGSGRSTLAGRWAYRLALVLGGFFALLGPCVFFTFQYDRDERALVVEGELAPDRERAFDVLTWSPTSRAEAATTVVQVREPGHDPGAGVAVFTAAPEVFLDARWTGERELLVRYRFGRDRPRPTLMLDEALGVSVRFVSVD